VRSKRWLLAACLWLPTVPALAAPENRPAEVSQKDWSHQAIADLAARGLVHGYKDAAFLDGKKLTRFEMATLVKRVIDSLLEIPVPAGNKPFVPETPGTAAARGQGYEAPPLGRKLTGGRLARTASFTEADLGTVKRLADAYSVELAVIGVNLEETMDRVGALEGRVETIEESLRDPEGPLQTVISNVSRIDKIRLSGYVQARYESFEDTREATGSGANSARPAVTDRFTLRRVRFVVAARPTDKVAVRLQVDAAGGTVDPRDAWIDYFVTGNPVTGPTATIGQMKVPFGFEVVQSSGVREAPERGRVARFFFPDERDRGFKVATKTGGKVFAEVGVFNGTQPGRTGRNNVDNNNDKDLAGRVRTSLFNGILDLGASINLGTTFRTALATGEAGRPGGNPSASNPYENDKFVVGVDAQLFLDLLDGAVIRAEWMQGKAMGTRAKGLILQYIQNVGKKWQAVVKWDYIKVDDIVLFPMGSGGTPLGDSIGYQGSATNLALGVVHHLDQSTRVKLFYEIHSRSNNRQVGYGATSSDVGKVPWQGNILRFEVITTF
jgi:hypothetical protein